MLLWSYYVIPNWYAPTDRTVYWDKFGKPEINAIYSLASPGTWWLDEEKAAALAN